MNPLYFEDIDKGDVLSGASHTVTREEAVSLLSSNDVPHGRYRGQSGS